MPVRDRGAKAGWRCPRGGAFWCQALLGLLVGAFLGHEFGAYVGDRLEPETGLFLMRGLTIAVYAWTIAVPGALLGIAVAWSLARWLTSSAVRSYAECPRSETNAEGA